MAQGIPEPGLVLYGVVQNVSSGGVTNRLTTGTLTCQITPAGGSPITLSTSLQNINDQFCYVLTVPFETRITGLSLSPGTLELTSSGTSGQRRFTLNGTNANFLVAGQNNFTFGPADRGRQERVDLIVGLEFVDANHNGIPDWWEQKYFHGFVDASADPDHDGMSNLQEYLAGTDPTDPQSVFKFINTQHIAQNQTLVTWSSVTNRSYTILRSPVITGTYTVIQSNLLATPPQNTFTDTNPPGGNTMFYRLRVE